MTVTQDQKSSKTRTFTVLQGTSFSVLRVIPLSVSQGETLTFISFAVESDWVLCMNASFHQGFVPLSHMERSSLPSQPSVGAGRPNDAMSRISSLQLPPHPSVERGRLNDAMSGISSLQLPPHPSVGRGRPNDAMSGISSRQLPPHPTVGGGRPNDAMFRISSLQLPPHPSLGAGRPNDAMSRISSLQLPPHPSVGGGRPNEETSRMSLQQQPHPSQRSSLLSESYDDDFNSMATASAIPSNVGESSSSSSESEGDKYLRVTTSQRGNADAELLEVNEGHIIHVLKVNPLGMIYGECLQTSKRGFIPKRHLVAATPLDLEPWYVGKCSRDVAERVLRSPSVNAKTFAVRESEKEACFVIGIRAADTIRHRKIRTTENKYYAWTGQNFDTLTNLVKYHMMATDETNIGTPYNKFLPGAKCGVPASAAPPLQFLPGAKCGVPASAAQPLRSKNLSVPPNCNTKPVDQNRGLEKWYIDENKIKPGHVLGTGHYGEVRLASIKDTGLKVAMKTFKQDVMDAEDFRNEAVAMKDLRHPYLVKLLGMSTINNGTQTPCIIMEYHPLGSLESYCKMQGHSPLLEKQKAIIAKHVASGMKYLTDCDYIHRDLAARNVLLASDLTPRIADFGLAKCMLSSNISLMDFRMPWKWSAPEVIGENKQWTTKCDVWSYGVLLWELYTNCQTPYETIGSKADLLEYLKEGKRLKIPADIRVSGNIVKVLKDCWTMRVEERTTFSRIEKIFQIVDVTTY